MDSYSILGSEKFIEIVSKHLGNLAGDTNYIYRVTACTFLK